MPNGDNFSGFPGSPTGGQSALSGDDTIPTTTSRVTGKPVRIDSAREILERLARQGNPDAQHVLSQNPVDEDKVAGIVSSELKSLANSFKSLAVKPSTDFVLDEDALKSVIKEVLDEVFVSE